MTYKVYTETDNYIAIICPPNVCNAGRESMQDAMASMLRFFEELEGKGFQPLHYARNIEAVVCRKTNKS